MKKAFVWISVLALLATLPVGCRHFTRSESHDIDVYDDDLTWMHVDDENGRDDMQTGSRRTTDAYRLKVGDQLVVKLMGIRQQQNIESRVDDEGNITLPFIDQIRAEGLSASELARSIRETYINRRIYNDININVLVPSQEFYYIRGEIRQPGRYPLGSGVTLVQAIATAGGFTEYASPRRTRIIRGGEVQQHNVSDYESNPDRDVNIVAEDVIIVRRSIL